MLSGMDLHLPIVLRDLEVVRVERPTPRLARITLGGPQLHAGPVDGHELPPFRSPASDDHVRIVLPDPVTGRLVLPERREGHLHWPHDPPALHRDYTVRRFDPDAGTHGEVVLDLVLHGDGPAASWAERVAVGERCHVAGPRGSHLPDEAADRWVLVADETGLPAVGRFLDEHHGTRPIDAVVLVEDAAEEQPDLPGVTWVHRRDADGRRCGDDADLLTDVVTDLPTAPGQVWAWVAAEAGSVRAVRARLQDRFDLSSRQVRGVAYWRRRTAGAHPLVDESVTALRRAADLLTPWAIRVAVTLGLLDAIADGADTAEAIADRTATDARGVAYLLTHLADHDVVSREDGRFRLEAQGRLLLAGTPAHEALHLDGAAGHIDRGWAGLRHAVRTGEPGFDTVLGAPFWDVVNADAELARSFDAYIASVVGSWAPGVVAYLDRIDARSIVDVGGGDGTFLASALSVDPDRTGVVVELAHSAAAAAARFAANGLSDRATAVVGDFREAVPTGHDTYLLAQILHDWDDEDAARILTRCAEAAGPDGRVLVVERLVGGDHHHAHAQLMMFNLFAARERDFHEFAALAARAGLEVIDDRPVGDDLHVLQLRAAGATSNTTSQEGRP